MAYRQKPETTLGSEHPDLHDKLKRMPVKAVLSGDATLAREDLLKGLRSSSRHEFLARCLLTSRSFNALLAGIGDPEIGEAVVSLGDDSGRLAESLLDTLGGAVGRLPRHPIKAARTAELLSNPAGAAAMSRLLSTEGGSRAASELYSDPAGAEILDGVHSLGGLRTLSGILQAKTAGHTPGQRESVRLLWPAAKPVSTRLFHEEPTDQEISSRLTAGDGRVRYAALSELFSSEGKTKAFIRYAEDGRNAAYVAALIREKPVRSLLALYDALKTDGGPGRLATAVRERPGIASSLAADAAGRQVIYSVYNAPAVQPGEPPAGRQLTEELLGHGGSSAAKILCAMTQARLEKMKPEHPDMPLDKPLDNAADIIKERQA